MLRVLLFLIISILSLLSPFSDANGSTDRIYNGTKADILDYPYQIALLMLEDYQLCSGAILSERFIITGGKCIRINALFPEDITITVNSKFWKNATRMAVQDIWVHPDYSDAKNDIAILRLVENIVFGPGAAPVQLPDRGSKIAAGSPVNVTSWGFTEGMFFSDELLSINLHVAENEVCDGQFYILGYDPVYNICVAGEGDGQSTCTSDYGSPMVNDGVLWGFLSYQGACGEGPFVFANVSAPPIRDFITQITGL